MSVIAVTGTDTDVGKTVFAAALAVALGASYWKPVQAGLEDGSDAASVESLGVPRARIVPEAYRLTTPCSPHRAAELDGIVIDPARLAPPPIGGDLVVEGAGGALVPLVFAYVADITASRSIAFQVPMLCYLLIAAFALAAARAPIVSRAVAPTAGH